MKTAVVRLVYTKSVQITDEEAAALDTMSGDWMGVEDEVYDRAVSLMVEDGLADGREEEIVEVLNG